MESLFVAIVASQQHITGSRELKYFITFTHVCVGNVCECMLAHVRTGARAYVHVRNIAII